ncbi:unnamed protein product [Clonostachys rosea]|uniref:Helicase C-terminal domain-containing protein n=1 Tax=Bionectria ochroleuca TaxID=29856 RepID=A0ABY6UGV1_BIOOC|nr:unnamed protein product [Clonostachys rosea]
MFDQATFLGLGITVDSAGRNRNSTSAATSSLKAISRWAVSGTPVQNSLADLAGLLSFLGFSPYNDPRAFDNHISQLLRSGETTEASRRLKVLCNSIMIRRSRKAIELPPREDRIIRIEFSGEEEAQYKSLEASISNGPAEMEDNEPENSRMMPTIQLIHKLRTFCNLGLSFHHQGRKPAPTPELHDRCREASRIMEAACDVISGIASCAECCETINFPDTDALEAIADFCSPVYVSKCSKIFCQNCELIQTQESSTKCSCTDIKNCPRLPLPIQMLEQAREDLSPVIKGNCISTKINTLVNEICKRGSEKHVVFSFWKTSLDMVYSALDKANIRSLRIDGTVSLQVREKVLKTFQNDDTFGVILVTISSGGVGLDLTSASCVHLLEPQWNPAIEDQALARVHRMGQRKPVTATRYAMKDSIEEASAPITGHEKGYFILIELS